jgi:hypothetical protein
MLGGCSANQVLAWDAGANRWNCSTPSTGTGNISGTGVSGRIAFFDSADNLTTNEDLFWDNTQGGAYMIGAFDEFDYSNSTNVQAVLNDLDANFINYALAANTHPALQLAGTATYLSLNAGSQVLTQGAIDVSTAANITGVLRAFNGGTGVDGSTAPAGTLLIGTGTGFSVQALGGDATIASNGTFTLANSGVSAATYGSTTGIPVITVDAKGRITSASTAPLFNILDGTGSANYVARWSDDNTLTTGTLYDSGTQIGIGTNSPSDTIDIEGTGTIGLTINRSGVEGRIYNDGNLHVSGGGNNLWLDGGNIYLNSGNTNRVSLGSSTPVGTFDIKGAGTTDSLAFAIKNSADLYTFGIQDNGYVGIGTTDPQQALDVIGSIAASTDLIVGGTALSAALSNAGSGAYMIGVFDEFDFSNNTNVQAVLNDLDANFTNYALAGGTHPALQLAGTASYLSLNGSQVLTQSAIDVSTAANVTGVLRAFNGGTGVDGSTAPAGTLLIGTGTGFSVNAMGGDATIASNGTLALSSTGVSAATYGSATGIPVITVDAAGRITAASTALANFEQTLTFSNPLTRTGDTISLDVTTTGTTTTTASNSGLEIGSDGLRLLGGCDDNQVLAWDATMGAWKCATGSSSGLWTDGGGVTYMSSLSDSLAIGGTTASDAPFFYSVPNQALTLTSTGTADIFRINDEAGDNTPFLVNADGFVGIGNTNPLAALHVIGTTEQLRLGYDASNFTSFTIGSDGDITLSVNGVDSARFGSVNNEIYLPTTFSSAGDVSFSYDAIFTHQTASKIESYGPFSIDVGESFENNNFTLKTYGTGDAIFNTGGEVVLQYADPTLVFDTLNATDSDFWMGVVENSDSLNNDLFTIGLGTQQGSGEFFTINSSGLVGIGTTSPLYMLDVAGNIRGTTASLSHLNIGGEMIGDFVGQGLVTSGTALTVDVTTTGTTATTASNSGLELTADGVRLMGGCTDNQVLTWDAGASRWQCTDNTGGTSNWTDGGGTTYLSSLSDSLAIGGTTASDSPFFYDTTRQALTLTSSTTAPIFRINDVANDSTPFLVDANGSVGIGNTNPLASLHVIGTTEQMRLGYDANNYGSFTIGSNGDLTLSVNGTNSARFGSINNEFYLPTTFSAAGDVSFAYDVLFSNQIASMIKSNGPLTIENGDNYESNNLTLRTFNSGNVVVEPGLALMVSHTSPSIIFDSVNALDTDFWAGVVTDNDGFNDDVLSIGYGSSVGSNRALNLNNKGYLGVGVTTPAAYVDIIGSSTAAASLRIRTGVQPTNPATGDIYADGTNVYYYDGDSWEGLVGGGSTAAGGSLFTDGGGTTYLTATSDSFALGGTTASNAPFFYSVPNQALTLNSTGSADIFRINDEANDTTPFLVDATGQVGIGNTNPVAGIHVIGTTEQMRLGYNANNYSSFTIGSNGDLTLSVNGTNTARFGSVNNEFFLPTTFSAAGDASFSNDIIMTNQTASQIESYGPISIIAGDFYESNNLTLKTYNSGDIIMDLGRSLLLTNSAPGLVFDVTTAGDQDFWMGVMTNSTGTTAADTISIGTGSTLGTNPLLNITGTGRVGIGTTNPTLAFHVVGNGRFTGVGSGTFSNNLNIMADGTLTTATSDIRLKTDIEGMTNILEKVLQLNPVSFTWKSDDQHRTDLGLIAQEVDVLFPEITFTNPVDGYMGINYTKLTPILIAAMQEIDMKIDNMNGDIENVENLLTGTTAPLVDIQSSITNLTGDVAGVKDEMSFLKDELAALRELINGNDEISESTQSIEIVLDEVTETSESTQSTESVNMAVTPGDILMEMQNLYDKFVSLFEDLNISATEESGLLVNADMNVLGDTTLNNVIVTGDLMAGLIKVDTLENSIGIMGVPCYDSETCDAQTLYIQKGLTGNVDFMDGAVVIAADGTLNVEGEIKANVVTAEEFQVTGTSNLIGSDTITAGNNQVVVTSDKVKSNSKIFVTATSQTGGQALIVTNKTDSQSFTVAIESTNSNDVNFDWWILNVE